ncbi:MAG TPA: hypothetical protein DCW29_06990 [Janthinobacterium sp.]|nr:hypothetical protein [Janthinobacterium sp.]
MGLLSFLSKNKQESTDDSAYVARDDENALARSKRATTAGEPAARRGKQAKASADDPVLPEKKRARRRLVGAVALALAVAVGLPMILDSEPKPLATDIDIQIPSKDKVAPQPMPRAVAAADTLDAREAIVDAPASPAAAAPAREVAEVKAAPAQHDGRQDVKAPAQPEAKTPAKAESKPEAKSVVKHDKPAEPKSADKPAKPAHEDKPVHEDKPAKAEPPRDTARALAILEGKAGDKPAAESAPQKYVVQVAALATQEKVNELQGRLKEAGITSFTHKVPTQSGERIRVQVGPLSKDEAEKVRAKLGKLGLSGFLVAN